MSEPVTVALTVMPDGGFEWSQIGTLQTLTKDAKLSEAQAESLDRLALLCIEAIARAQARRITQPKRTGENEPRADERGRY